MSSVINDYMKKVDLYARSANGEWVLIFKDIYEYQALKIWEAGFMTGENRFSIEDDESRRISEMNKRAMHSNPFSGKEFHTC